MAPPSSVRVFAPAKINLTLHVTGQRADGYHLLDSLVAFADVGDQLVMRSGGSSMTVAGAEAGAIPTDANNLVLKAAALFEEIQSVGFALTKTLPVASGIGGGSADAAAACRGMIALCQSGALTQDSFEQAIQPLVPDLMRLGADIPMCLMSRAARVSGIGEKITPVPNLPALNAVLVNPRLPVATPAVFKALVRSENPPMPETLPVFAGEGELTDWLAYQRNDLQVAATTLVPTIAEVLEALEASPGCGLARMSGSGATCFGLFGSAEEAAASAEALRTQQPGWWVEAAGLGSQTARSMPQPT